MPSSRRAGPLPFLAVVLLACLSLSTALARSLDLRGSLLVNGTLDIDATVSLSSAAGIRTTPVLSDKTFVLWDVQEGAYVLTVLNRLEIFHHYLVRVPAVGEPKVTLFQHGLGPAGYEVDDAVVRSLPYPMVIRSLGKMVYGEVPTSFNPLRMLQANPLLLLLLAGGLLTLALPKILTYLDPETMAEVARDQSEMHARVASFQNLDLSAPLSKFLAGTTGPAPSKPAASPKVDAQVPALAVPQVKLGGTNLTPKGTAGKGKKKKQ